MRKTKIIFEKIKEIEESELLTRSEKKDVIYDFTKLINAHIRLEEIELDNLNLTSRWMLMSIKDSLKAKTPVKREKQAPPEYEEFKEYAHSKSDKVDEVLLKRKYLSWKENEWKDGNHKPIKNWKTKLLNTLRYLETDGKTRKKYNRSEAVEKAKTLFGSN